LCWYLRGWREFLGLLAADTGTTANVQEATKAIEWLEEVRFEPELLKSEVQRYVGPVVKQLEGIEIADHLGALAADILLRLGHLLFVLDIGREPKPPETPLLAGAGMTLKETIRRAAEQQISQTLAFRCLGKAAQCDRRNTLAGADLIKARLRFRAWFGGTLRDEYDKELMPQELDTVAHHWPGGSDDYENLARVAEYLMLRAQLHDSAAWRAEREKGRKGRLTSTQREEADVARGLLNFFFMHTDSINVRKSQVHTFLMRERRTTRLRDHTPGPAIEFVCMRRYSSAFPLLPRPSTFRALGGGYFVRLHGGTPDGRGSGTHDSRGASDGGDTPDGQESGHGDRDVAPSPFGIVIDPGVDFIENLYRTGYSLSDIDMILITHDHIDHLGSLDPLLSLLHEHSHYREHLHYREHQKTSSDKKQSSNKKPGKLMIYANESVVARYRKVAQLKKSSKFEDLSKFATNPGEPQGVDRWPKHFEIVAMSSKDLDDTGHLDLSNKPSLGVCIRVPQGPSIAIAGDTPRPPDRRSNAELYRNWHKAWRPALGADVLVCHLSTVPLTELRQLAGIDAAEQPLRADDRESITAMAGSLNDGAAKVLENSDRRTLAPFARALTQIRKNADAISSETEDLNVYVGRVDKLVDEIRETVKSIVDKMESETPPDLPSEIYDVVDEANALVKAVDDLPHDARDVWRIRRELQAARPRLQGQIEFGLWLGSHRPSEKEPKRTADLLRAVNDDWLPPPQHSYLLGVIRWAREYERARRRRRRDSGLLVVGELSEELGTVRSKVAMQLNTKVFAQEQSPGAGGGEGKDAKRQFSALSGDIGLHILAGPRPPSPDEINEHDQGSPKDSEDRSRSSSNLDAIGDPVDARVLCTICDLDTDRVPGECFHPAHCIHEVCVKGENEGIFYNCTEHNPSTQEDPVFLEQLERFDIFGR